ncbi:MAG: hypothetical protein HPZ91_04310 [Lentisphaeria bacterium]|nr:hypothetical protein [Lentisphaeria bacterium]
MKRCGAEYGPGCVRTGIRDISRLAALFSCAYPMMPAMAVWDRSRFSGGVPPVYCRAFALYLSGACGQRHGEGPRNRGIRLIPNALLIGAAAAAVILIVPVVCLIYILFRGSMNEGTAWNRFSRISPLFLPPAAGS